MVPVLIALGANVGDPIANLREAVRLLGEKLEVREVSRVVESAPMYKIDQPKFYNAALLASTDLPPLALLQLLKGVEEQVGRVKRDRNGPREIDLDVIAYGALRYRFVEGADVRLEIPHPRAHERRFVLQPLADVAPAFELPGQGRVASLLAAVGQEGDVIVSPHQLQ